MPTPAEKLADEILAGRRILLWIGAGNSFSAGIPTDSPNNAGLAFRLALTHYGSEDAATAGVGAGFRVSGLTEILGKPRVRDLILQQGWDDLEPAPAHKAIAALIEEQLDIEIVTVNYDRLLERSLSAANVDAAIVCSQGTVEAFREGRPVVVKAHGCPYIDPLADHLILREVELANPPAWLVNFLRGKLQEKIFVYAGFSGNAPYVRSAIQAVIDALEGGLGESYATDILPQAAVFGGESDLGDFLDLSNVPQQKYCDEGSDKFFGDTANFVFRHIALAALATGEAKAARHGAVSAASLKAVLSSMTYQGIRNFAKRLEIPFKPGKQDLCLHNSDLETVFKWMLIFVSVRILEDGSYRPVLACPYRAGPNSHASAPIVFFNGRGGDASDCADRIRELSMSTEFRGAFQLQAQARWYAVVLNCRGTKAFEELTIVPKEQGSVVGGYSPAIFVDENTLRDNLANLGDYFQT